MKGNQSFSLLEGTYEIETARQLILSCLNEQLKFFNRELLKRRMYGGDIQKIEMEMEKIESRQKQVLDLFQSQNMANINSLNINGVIAIAV